MVRWRLDPDGMRPAGDAETVVAGLPGDRSHGAKSILFGRGDTMFVNIGAPSNSGQGEDRVAGNPGRLPCPELETRGGIWAFSASRMNQRPQDGTRYAAGIRNAMRLALGPKTRALFATQHRRDLLAQHWGFRNEYGAENPGEARTVAAGAEGETSLRAAGVAMGPDGALYVSADRNGRIWKVTRS